MGTASKATGTKLANTILFLLERCEPEHPGLMALLKMLWYADYWHYREHLRVITGAEYVAMQNGPVLADYRDVFAELEVKRVLKRELEPVLGRPNPKEKYLPLVATNEDLFSESELNVLHRVVELCGGKTGTELSRRTHLDGPWLHVWNEQHPNQPIHRMAFRWLDNLPDDDDCALALKSVARPAVKREIAALTAASLQSQSGDSTPSPRRVARGAVPARR